MNGNAPSTPTGRFAPSPSGRMHLGNVFTALLSWLSVKSRGGRWILRIEDLDPQRSKPEHSRLIEDDLLWLGLKWDEGGMDDERYMQSHRSDIYHEYYRRLVFTGYTYPCRCTRADIMAASAPHQSDGRVLYAGTCRPAALPCIPSADFSGTAVRLYVPDVEIEYTDGVFGVQRHNLARECGDFVVRRADGAWAYQLAVTVDDALMGVTEVMRGCDLLLSATQQIYLRQLLELPGVEYVHLPLVCNSLGLRLSKRDQAQSMAAIRESHTPQQLLGRLACMAQFIDRPESISLSELLCEYRRDKIPTSIKI
ncbi:MAG: tRNA glutamyl-Q(34) synthetase GluQRS [Muribaculaceae bacterium]|nr:tRNA glutamyl-Q(34) synthetase GluQRS [Muribaculaceae bacterium]